MISILKNIWFPSGLGINLFIGQIFIQGVLCYSFLFNTCYFSLHPSHCCGIEATITSRPIKALASYLTSSLSSCSSPAHSPDRSCDNPSFIYLSCVVFLQDVVKTGLSILVNFQALVTIIFAF